MAWALNFLPSHQNWLKEFGWNLPGEAPSPILDMGEEAGWRVVGGEACLPLVPVYAHPAGLLSSCSRLGRVAWLGIVLAAPVHVIILRLQSFCALFYHLLS